MTMAEPKRPWLSGSLGSAFVIAVCWAVAFQIYSMLAGGVLTPILLLVVLGLATLLGEFLHGLLWRPRGGVASGAVGGAIAWVVVIGVLIALSLQKTDVDQTGLILRTILDALPILPIGLVVAPIGLCLGSRIRRERGSPEAVE